MITVNIVTVSRIPLAFLFGLCSMQSKYAVIFCSAIFLLVVISDLLDGKLARRYDVVSNIGAQLDVWCDFIFIIISCISLCATRNMNVLIPCIIVLKFIEFMFTSHMSRREEKRSNVLLFDPFGRILALSFYGLLIIALLLNGFFLKMQTGLIIVIAILGVVSSLIRVKYCLRIRERSN